MREAHHIELRKELQRKEDLILSGITVEEHFAALEKQELEWIAAVKRIREQHQDEMELMIRSQIHY